MRSFLHKYVVHLFILAVVACAIIIFLHSNSMKYLLFQTWADYLSNTIEIPQSGHYQCEELHLSISFGKNTSLLFPDGKVVALAIDYGGNMYELHQGDPIIRGNYTSRLSKGYIEMTFLSLPMDFSEGRTYRFYLLKEDDLGLR